MVWFQNRRFEQESTPGRKIGFKGPGPESKSQESLPKDGPAQVGLSQYGSQPYPCREHVNKLAVEPPADSSFLRYSEKPLPMAGGAASGDA